MKRRSNNVVPIFQRNLDFGHATDDNGYLIFGEDGRAIPDPQPWWYRTQMAEFHARKDPAFEPRRNNVLEFVRSA